MTSFVLGLPPRVSFGPGSAAELPAVLAGLGSRPLIVTGAHPSRVAHLLPGMGTGSDVTVTGEPTLDAVRAADQVGRRRNADSVVAIGGGSVIDLAKATAMLLANGGDPLDYLEVIGRGEPITKPSLPLVAVPTTAGTGAEVTANAVLAAPERRVKASLRSGFMIPAHAIVDPELTLACPPAVTASAGLDALTQCLEPYLSRRANPVTDAWARTGLLAAGRGLRRAYADGADLPARTDMALASLMGGLALANAKLGAVHAFASVIGGMAPSASHGAVCAALLLPVCRANLARADADLAHRYNDAARWMTGDSAATAVDGLAWLDQTAAQLQVPSLSEWGLSVADSAEIVAKAARASSMAGNPVVLGDEELAQVFREAL